MNRTGVIFSPVFYQHNPGRDHPESPQRLRSILNALGRPEAKGNSWKFILPERADVETVGLVHAIEYIKLVKAICKSGGGLLDSGDTVVSRKSFETALYAVGGSLTAANLVHNRRLQNAFVLARPPGHHACRFKGFGFCIFNNVAVSAKYLLQHCRLKRVLVLDIDSHHGNGTQEIFYRTDKVLYISLHEDPTDFPRTGFIDETGEGRGEGYSVNIPLPYGTGDHVYLKAIREVVEPITRQFKPQFILVSAGLDGHYRDPIGNLSLSAPCIDKAFAAIVDLAKLCQDKLVAVLEGGYNVQTLGELAALAIRRMSGESSEAEEREPSTLKTRERQGLEVLKEVKAAQREYWRID